MPSLVETMAAAIDPDIWEIDLPLPTRHATIEFYERRRKSIKDARAALQAMIDAGITPVMMKASYDLGFVGMDEEDYRAMLRAELDASKETP